MSSAWLVMEEQTNLVVAWETKDLHKNMAQPMAEEHQEDQKSSRWYEEVAQPVS